MAIRPPIVATDSGCIVRCIVRQMGTAGWRQQVVDFVTGPEARLITIRVVRVPGNPLIKGTFWLDDVQLAAVSTSGKIN